MKRRPRLILTLVLTLLLIAALAHKAQPTYASREVRVFKDGLQVIFPDQKAVIENGRTLVPVRFVSEALGADVTWIEDDKKVVVSQANRNITLKINERDVLINGAHYTLDVPARLLNGRTMVPLRFVSEVLGAHVEWSDPQYSVIIRSSQTICLTSGETITLAPFGGPITWATCDGRVIQVDQHNKLTALEPGLTKLTATTIDGIFTRSYLVRVLPERPVHFRNSHSLLDYLALRIVGDKITFEGQTTSDNSWAWVRIEVAGAVGSQHVAEIRDRRYAGELSIPAEPGSYSLSVYMGQSRYGTYRSYEKGVPFERLGTQAFFSTSPMFKHNILQQEANLFNPSEHLIASLRNREEEKAIRELATTIANGLTNDYDRLLAVNNWVTENIYYDYDALRTGKYGRTDAYGTLQSKRSVCQGYAELTAALLRSLNIPCRVASGFALGIGLQEETWHTADHTIPNHAWNEAYVDGRWVILDTTWNSGNVYENGTFKARTSTMKYFDPTLEAFSLTHKIMR